MKDFFGTEIKAGDTVAYPVRRKSSMTMEQMTVERADEKLYGYKADGRRVVVQNINTCIVKPKS